MTLPASDNFNRANENPLDSSFTVWEDGTAQGLARMQLLSNSVQSASTGDAATWWKTDAFNANQWSECKIISGSDGGPAVRCSSAGCYYWTPYSDGEVWRHKQGGTWTKIGELNFTITATDVVRIQATGTTTTVLEVFKNGVSQGSVSDASSPLTSGSAGLYTVGATALDDWQGGNYSTDVTVNLNAAAISAAGQSVTASTPVTISLNVATLTAIGQTTTVSAPGGALIPAGVICIWPGTHASIPTGWSRVTALDGLHPKGAADATNPGGTGGANVHQHTTSSHDHTTAHVHTVPTSPAGSGETLRDSGSTRPPTAHTHASNPNTVNPTTTLTGDTPSTDSPNSEPPYFVGIFIESDGTPTGFPATAIIAWDGASAPSGWTFCDGGGSTPDLRGKYIKGAATLGDGGGTGGNLTHGHTVASHTHGDNYSHAHPNVTSAQTGAGMVGGPGSGGNAATALQTHTHTLAIGTQATDAITGNTDSTDTPNHEPPYVLLGWIQNTSGAVSYPDQSIGLWIGTLVNIPEDWDLCNGTGTTDTRSRFIKGATTLAGVGTTGGNLTHSHTATGHTHAVASHAHTVTDQGDGAGSNNTAGSTGCSTTAHTHPSWSNTGAQSFTSGSGTPTVTDYTDTQPSYYAVAWIQYTVSIAPTTVNLNAAALSAGGQALSVVPGDVSVVLTAAALTASGPAITVDASAVPTTVVLNVATIVASPQMTGIRHRSILVGNGYSDVTPRQLVRTADNRLWVATWEFDHYPQGTDTGLGQTLKMYKADQTGTPSSFTRMDSTHEPVDVNAWAIAYGGGNVIHVLWTKRASWGTDGTDNYVYYCQFDTSAGTWGTPETIESTAAIRENGQGWELCAIAVDAHHVPHIVYLKSDGTRCRVNYRHRTGGAWSSATVVDDQSFAAGYTCWHPGIVFDTGGRIVVTWIRGTDNIIEFSETTARLFVRVYASGAWGTTHDVVGADTWRGIDTGTPIYIDSSNRYHICHIDTSKYVNYRYSDDLGATWTANHPSSGTYLGDDPTPGPGPAGTVRIYTHGLVADSYPVVYWEGTGGNGAWGSTHVYSNDNVPDDCSVNVRWSGNVQLFENRYDIAYWVSNYPTNVLYIGTEVWGADPTYVSLNSATLTASGQAVTTTTDNTIGLNAAVLTASGQAVTIIVPITVELNVATVTASGQVLTAAPGEAIVAFLAAAITASGQSLVVVPGDIISVLLAAALDAQGQQLSAVPGEVSISLTAASLVASGQVVTVSLATPTVVELLAANLTAQGQVLTAVGGPITSNLSAAVLTADGQALSTVPGEVSILLAGATLEALGQTLSVVPGEVSLSLLAATLSAQGQVVSVVPGAVSTILAAATLTANGQTVTISIISGVLVELAVANLTSQGQAVSAIGGPVSSSLSAATLTAVGQNVTISAPPSGLVANLFAAVLSATGQTIATIPGAVSTTLTAAMLQALGQPVTAVPDNVPVAFIGQYGGGTWDGPRPDYKVEYRPEVVDALLQRQIAEEDEELLWLI